MTPPPPKEFWRLSEWFSDLTQDQNDKLKKFFDETKNVNNALSLISTKTLPFADVIHFADCILASRLVYQDSKPNHVVDIGTGNGFPGIVFAVLYPEVKLTIIDRDQKKIDFLKNVINILKLQNVELKCERVDLIQTASLNCVISRGFAPISKAILALRKPFNKNGNLYMLKSEEWATEIANIPSQLCSFWTPHLVGEYKLPIGEVKFAVVKLVKIAQ